MCLRIDILDEHRIDHCLTYVCVFVYIKDCMSQIQFWAEWSEKDAESVRLGLKVLALAVLQGAFVKSVHCLCNYSHCQTGETTFQYRRFKQQILFEPCR